MHRARTLLHRLAALLALFGLAAALGACGGGGGAATSSTAAPVTLAPPVSLTADAGRQRVTLNWPNVPSATSFSIYYATAPGVSKASTRIADAHSIYVLRDLPNGVTHYFAVASFNGSAEGVLSAEVSATPSATPPQPAPVTVRAAAQSGQVELSWTPGFEATADPTSYTIYYSGSAHPTKASALKLGNAVSPQTVTGLANGSSYYFVVSATTAAGESALSYEVSATPALVAPPAAPTGFRADEGDGAITLRWNASAGATGYNLYYGTEFDVTRASGARVAGVSSPFVLGGLNNKTAYFLTITAVGAGGEGFEAPQASATPVAARPVQAMLSIPAGSLRMGDNLLDPIAPAPYSTPVHTVTVSAFSLERHETTYAQWQEVRDWALTHGYDLSNPGRNGGLTIGSNMPVTQVTWTDVVKWLNARSEKEGRVPVYYTDAGKGTVYRTGIIQLPNDAVQWSANGYRLPTDAEWEWAARGGLAGKTYPWGDVLDAGMANYDRGTSTSVGSYPANGYGLHDMAGNVWEWVWDRESANYNADAAGVTNPHGPDSGVMRVRRGGSYVYGTRYLRNFDRMFRDLGYNGPYFGFRAASSQP